jgi:hypothetical protein
MSRTVESSVMKARMRSSPRAWGTAAEHFIDTGEQQRPGNAGGAAPYCPVPLREAWRHGVKPNMTGFLHFTPASAHCVLPRWSPAAPSRNLAL